MTGLPVEDSKRLRKELGFKSEDIRSYGSTANPTGSTAASSPDKKGLSSFSYSNSLEDANRAKRFIYNQTCSVETMMKVRPYLESTRKSLTESKTEFGNYYEERDDEEDKGFSPRLASYQEDFGEDEDDAFSLPDLDMEIQQRKKRKPNVSGSSNLASVARAQATVQRMSSSDDGWEAAANRLRTGSLSPRKSDLGSGSRYVEKSVTNNLKLTIDGDFERAITRHKPDRPKGKKVGLEFVYNKNQAPEQSFKNLPCILSPMESAAKKRKLLMEKKSQQAKPLSISARVVSKVTRKKDKARNSGGSLRTGAGSYTRKTTAESKSGTYSSLQRRAMSPTTLVSVSYTPQIRKPTKPCPPLKINALAAGGTEGPTQRIHVQSNSMPSPGKDLPRELSLVARLKAAEENRNALVSPVNLGVVVGQAKRIAELDPRPPLLTDESKVNAVRNPSSLLSTEKYGKSPIKTKSGLSKDRNKVGVHAPKVDEENVSSEIYQIQEVSGYKQNKKKVKSKLPLVGVGGHEETVSKLKDTMHKQGDSKGESAINNVNEFDLLDPEMPVLIPEVDSIISPPVPTKSEPPSLKKTIVVKQKKNGLKIKDLKKSMDKATSTRSANNSDDEQEFSQNKDTISLAVAEQEQSSLNTALDETSQSSESAPPNPNSLDVKVEKVHDRNSNPLLPNERPAQQLQRPIEQICLDEDPFSFDHVPEVPNSEGSSQNQESTSYEEATMTMMPPPSKRPPRSPKKAVPKYNPYPVTPKPLSSQSGTSGTRTDATKMSHYNLLTSTRLLRAGMGLMEKYANKELNSKEVGRRLGIELGPGFNKTKVSPPRKQRELSPDITDFRCTRKDVPTPNNKAEGKSGQDNVSVATQERGGSDSSNESQHSDDEGHLSDPEGVEGGEQLVREVLSRSGGVDTQHSDYYDETLTHDGDDNDLSQRSYCLLPIVPEYQRKSRMFKMHSKNIHNLTCEELIEHYTSIKPALRQIFEGEISSQRNTYYLQGRAGRKKLKHIMVSVPYSNDQCSLLLSHLFDYFIPDTSIRQSWSDYINYVILAEAMIRIYARVNDVSDDMAETEMRYGACY